MMTKLDNSFSIRKRLHSPGMLSAAVLFTLAGSAALTAVAQLNRQRAHRAATSPSEN
jgi:hypothetical protein